MVLKPKVEAIKGVMVEGPEVMVGEGVTAEGVAIKGVTAEGLGAMVEGAIRVTQEATAAVMDRGVHLAGVMARLPTTKPPTQPLQGTKMPQR